MVERVRLQRVVMSLASLVIFAGILVVTSPDVKGFEKKKKGWLGVSVQEMTPSLREAMKMGDRSGLLITDVVDGSPADDADLKEEDVIVKFEGKEVEKADDFARMVRNNAPGTKVELVIIRDAEKKEVEITLGKRKKKRIRHFGWGTDREIHLFDRPRLGVQVHALNQDLAPYFKVDKNQGVLVLKVMKESPAEQAGLKAGDVITKIEDEQVSDPEDLIDVLEDYEDDDVVTVEYVRKGKKEKLEIELEDAHGFGFESWRPNRPNIRIHRFHRDDDVDGKIIIVPDIMRQRKSIQLDYFETI